MVVVGVIVKLIGVIEVLVKFKEIEVLFGFVSLVLKCI